MESQDSEVTGLGLPLVQCEDPYLAPVHVSAGGTHYTTTLSTLTRCEESKLAKLFNGTLPIALDPVNHHYFMDINGSVFAHVLDYLRYGELILPLHFDQMPLLVKQAEQLEIWPLVELLNKRKEVEKEEFDSETIEAEDNPLFVKKIKRRRQRNKSKKDSEVKEEMDNLLSRLGESFQGVMTELIKELNEEKKKEVNAIMDSLMEKLENIFERLILDNGSKIEAMIEENEDKRGKEDARMDNLVKNLGDGFMRLIAASENKIETIVKISEDKQQKDDERIDHLVKSLEKGFQRMSADSKSKMGILKENERMGGMMKKLADSFQQMLIVSEGKVEKIIKMKEIEWNNSPRVNKPALPVGVITVRVPYIKYEDESYSIFTIFTKQNKPNLVLPKNVTTSGSGRCIMVWTYTDINSRMNYIIDIATQLISCGYKLITANPYDYDDDIRKGCDYMFVRS